MSAPVMTVTVAGASASGSFAFETDVTVGVELRPLIGGHETDESRRVEEVGLKVRVGREQPAERGLGLGHVVLDEKDPREERQRPAALGARRLCVETRQRRLAGLVEFPLGEEIGRGPQRRLARILRQSRAPASGREPRRPRRRTWPRER